MADVQIIDVSPRDGLQNEPAIVPTEKKKRLIEMLVDSNVKKIEATSFVHPRKVPQMADAEQVIKQCETFGEIEFVALIPNQKGFERAKQTNVSEVNWVTAATETFNCKNIGMSIDENFGQFKTIVQESKALNIKICFSIAVSFGCPYEGEVAPAKVISLVERAAEVGVDRIGIADTIGIATPKQVKQLLAEVMQVVPSIPIAIHLHDTRGLGLANAYAALEAGVNIFETSVSGIGGCPFAPGAAGNLATEDLVYMLERMGVRTDIDFEKLLAAADFAASLTSNQPLGRIRQVEKRGKCK
ncbi:hydroxymethylglutaryl-CoA lyase [Geobacillus zalihae]|uniref:Hydroxymethylglutaryl-CoA lyase n=1 Tax=Geobacillus zalihae TaxID=213419 RepID=A0A7H1RUV0_9BACL|nr:MULTISPECIES: hydroxymethylglutaryl-CoA lyase [Geobacillus]AGE21227.1 hydroxymethylglutaryl-CoA lyase [Geobacillus sp. GHH01]EPR28811.1 Hydroxymethylglutaryl-CoA lyase [Geobacillus sp. WSUCF1]MCG6794354.1 hydroxymethylglutaryl-CoA lyase [Geobacillus sp. YHL]OQP24011.1 hydroxymethylglutaryl-CoA lyase [Geobacillus zalihae]QNU18039.1 hydroxymethylglutaryl-CoA lyase [Geobacillus zalihae]